MFRSGFDLHLRMQNFEMNAMVAFNFIIFALGCLSTENTPLFYGGFQTYEHFHQTWPK